MLKQCQISEYMFKYQKANVKKPVNTVFFNVATSDKQTSTLKLCHVPAGIVPIWGIDPRPWALQPHRPNIHVILP